MDSQEPVKVTLSVEDWGYVINAISVLNIPLERKARINTTIFDSARDTERVLS